MTGLVTEFLSSQEMGGDILGDVPVTSSQHVTLMTMATAKILMQSYRQKTKLLQSSVKLSQYRLWPILLHDIDVAMCHLWTQSSKAADHQWPPFPEYHNIGCRTHPSLGTKSLSSKHATTQHNDTSSTFPRCGTTWRHGHHDVVTSESTMEMDESEMWDMGFWASRRHGKWLAKFFMYKAMGAELISYKYTPLSIEWLA